jgi:putative acetyltransferase
VTSHPAEALAAPCHLRAEVDDDRDVIRRVVAQAFSPDTEVAGLVDALRESAAFLPELSLVATVDDAVVGHVLLTAAVLMDELGVQRPVLVLSPLSVLPQQQRRGIGAALVRQALSRADARGEEMVVLQGSPAYYPRFGFRDSRTLGVAMDLPDWAPPEAAMACPLSAYRPSTRGRLVESQPFLDLTH